MSGEVHHTHYLPLHWLLSVLVVVNILFLLLLVHCRHRCDPALNQAKFTLIFRLAALNAIPHQLRPLYQPSPLLEENALKIAFLMVFNFQSGVPTSSWHFLPASPSKYHRLSRERNSWCLLLRMVWGWIWVWDEYGGCLQLLTKSMFCV